MLTGLFNPIDYPGIVYANTIFSTMFTGVTVAAPSSFSGGTGAAPGNSAHVANGGYVPNYRYYSCDNLLTGDDTATGFAIPAGAPLYGTINIGYGVYLIDKYNGFATYDQAGLDASASIVIENAFVRGISTKALSITLKDPNVTVDTNGYMQQIWYMIYRDVAAGTDLSEFAYSYDMLAPSNLDDLLSTTLNKIAFTDIKAGSTTLGGEYRFGVTWIKADAADALEFSVTAGTIGYMLVADNDANATGPALTKEEFFRVKNYSVRVPLEDYFGLRVYCKRGASYADTTSGRLRVDIKLPGDSIYTNIFDIKADTLAAYEIAHPLQCLFPSAGAPHAARNIHMGERGNKIQRMFLAGLYGKYNADTDVTIKIANVKIYDGAPVYFAP